MTPTISIDVVPTETTLPRNGSAKDGVVYETRLSFLTEVPGKSVFGAITLLVNSGVLKFTESASTVWDTFVNVIAAPVITGEIFVNVTATPAEIE